MSLLLLPPKSLYFQIHEFGENGFSPQTVMLCLDLDSHNTVQKSLIHIPLPAQSLSLLLVMQDVKGVVNLLM